MYIVTFRKNLKISYFIILIIIIIHQLSNKCKKVYIDYAIIGIAKKLKGRY